MWATERTKKRMRWMWIVFLVLFLMLIGKLVHVQFIQHELLTKRAEESWDREIPVSSLRGNIVDRNGKLIVGNKLAPTLYFVPAQNEQPQKAAKELADLLKVDEEALAKKMSQRVSIVKIAPEAKNISNELAEKIQQKNIPGLYTGLDYIRYYPYDQLLARLIGFTGYDNKGLAGLEYQYNDLLMGNSSAIRLFTDAKGASLPHVQDSWKEGKDGATMELTIDVDVQKVVERELAQAMVKYEADQAMAIAMNPKTGEILALSSYPTFHPSAFAKVDSTIYNRNLPVWMTYEPGSTFKIITLSAALEEGVVDLEKEHFYDPGYSMVEGAKLRCWQRRGHGDETFLEVVQNSCNPGFIELGRRIGPKKLQQYTRDFGFGQVTGSNMAGESTGILFSEKGYGPVEHATTSFGQGISVTPIQQVQAVAAAINGGTLYKPYIVKNLIDADTGKVLKSYQPEKKRQVIKPETSKKVREALESVVAYGSGRNAFRDHLRIGGKTGTAQKVEDGRYKDGEYIVSFIGFAPADDPQIVVYVAIDNPKNATQFGGVIAAPIVGQIIEDVHEKVGIKERQGQLEKPYRWGDVEKVRVPNLVGEKKEDITKMQYPFRIEWHGNGSKIASQLPKAESQIALDGIIHVYLEK
ncbi:stage V sporulation protein D [Viridibacillus sp. YIM B01967]|uniref:Stage V sporulation protein D n=1 Tax=Viridibacillus soli TaxID=2798301 RepID=A0ABS1H515_9BACL|nr:stage V sporulation protein D [Viridibacillus soli]MBK3494492.1 stage V sporulation protein D [Viridibacillus soli]